MLIFVGYEYCYCGNAVGFPSRLLNTNYESASHQRKWCKGCWITYLLPRVIVDLKHPEVTKGIGIFRPSTGHHQTWVLGIGVWVPEAVGSVVAPALWPWLGGALWLNHPTPVLSWDQGELVWQITTAALQSYNVSSHLINIVWPQHCSYNTIMTTGDMTHEPTQIDMSSMWTSYTLLCALLL